MVNGELKALIEYKWRKTDFEKAIPVNAFQFITLQELSKLSGVPLYYNVDPYKKYRVKRCGNGNVRDSYPIVGLNINITLKTN